MKRLPGLKNRWTLAGTVIAATMLFFAFVGIENGRLKLVDNTGFMGDEEISRTVERNPKNEVIKSTETTKIVSRKTLWDLLSLLGVPLVLALLGFWLQQIQQKRAEEAAGLQQEQAKEAAEREREQIEEAAKEEILQAYFDRISTLLIDRSIIALAVRQDKASNTSPAEPVADEQKGLIDAAKDVIRARTLSIMRRLKNDGDRKRSVILFLFETRILDKLKIDLSDVDLSDAYLSFTYLNDVILRDANLSNADIDFASFDGANLSNANLNGTGLMNTSLSGANLHLAYLEDALLSDANLSLADLSLAILKLADLSNANLNGANLSKSLLVDANLSNASLNDTNLSNTNLNGAIVLATDLSTAKGLTQEQLEGEHSPYLCKARLPSEITIDPNRDCKQLPQILQQRYPYHFKTIEDAQKHIDSL